MTLVFRAGWTAGAVAFAQAVVAAHAADPAGDRSSQGATSAAESPESARTLTLDIKGQLLGDALSELAQQAALQIVLYTEVGAGISSRALVGRYTPRRALDELLNGTPLDYEFINDRTVAIEPKSSPSERAIPRSSTIRPEPDGRPLLLAQADEPIVRRRGSLSARQFRLAQAEGQATASASGSEGASELAVQEITVTARRRAESLQTTPVAVTALSGEALQARGAETVDALSQFVPNLQFDGAAALSGGAYNATIFIRGIGQNDFAIFSDPGAAMYVDGVYLGRSIGGIMDAVDLERVEVLRGPQGTLFGRNTIGGAVNIISRQPEDTLGGEVSLTGGRFSRFDAKGTLNLPLSDTLLTRWTVARLTQDGYARRLTDGKDLGDKDALVGRMQALWKASDDIDVSLARRHTCAPELRPAHVDRRDADWYSVSESLQRAGGTESRSRRAEWRAHGELILEDGRHRHDVCRCAKRE